MTKLKITIDLSKIDKTRIRLNSYTKKDGTEVHEKLYDFEAIPKKQARTIKEGDTWELAETHFVQNAPSKGERERGEKMVILGGATQLLNKTGTTAEIKQGIRNTFKKDEEYPEEDINPEDIPF